VNILICGVAGLIALFLSVTTSTSFINFGAFLAFTSVNICVIVLFLPAAPRRAGAEPGRISGPCRRSARSWIYGCWSTWDATAKWLGLGWLLLGILYLIYLTRGLPPPTTGDRRPGPPMPRRTPPPPPP